MKSRRETLKTAAAAATLLPVLNAQHNHAPGTAGARPYKPKWATADEMRLLAKACDVIIPRTDTPGAADAKVHEFIDYTLQTDKKRQAALRDGLQWFATLKADEHAARLAAASQKPETREGRFFALIKDLTIDGYYSSREGLATELGWKGNTYLPDYKGCTHPEHQG